MQEDGLPVSLMVIIGAAITVVAAIAAGVIGAVLSSALSAPK